jgi:hypothetical protein
VGRAIGPKKVHRYSVEFKLTAVTWIATRGGFSGGVSGPTKDARLTLATLNHAVAHRHPPAGVLFHSDPEGWSMRPMPSAIAWRPSASCRA